MKYLAGLALGFVTGIAAFFVLMYVNPFAARPSVSPLAVTDQRVLHLQYSAVPEDAILYTDNGEHAAKPQPASVNEL